MLWESRFLYPPLFQLTRLVQAGAIDAETAREWAVKDRYPPEVVDALYAFWTASSAAKADTHLGKAQTQLWTATHRAYLRQDADDATVTAALTAAGVSAETVPQVLALWTIERDLSRLDLTPAQIAKAYKSTLYTLETAVSELVERGMTLEDASTFLGLSTGQTGPGP